MSHPRLILATLVIASALILAPSAGKAGQVIDKGSFKLYRHDRALGAETFEISEGLDSLMVQGRQFLTLPTPRGDAPLEKGVDILVGRDDYGLRVYQSRRLFQGATTTRALVVSDTHYVAYREQGGTGDGESRVLPPGHLFVMDSQVVTLFDLICRSLKQNGYVNRTINLLALGPRDTMLEARTVMLGNETIRWGSRPVVARKVQLVADSQTTFTMWVGAQGQLLRLSEPVGGLRAERDPPDIKPRPAPPKPREPSPGG
jgi:hypothetical protein